MAINYTYPVKAVPTSADDILIIDNADSSKATKRIEISTLPVSGGGGVTSIVAGTNVTITPSTGIGAVTINSSGGGSGTVTDVTASLPLASTGGATPAISLGGLSTLGNRSQVMAINSAGTGLEYVPQQVNEVVEANSIISKGDPLYVSGFNSGSSIAIVDKADASDPNKMPSVGIATANIILGATGEMKVIGVANSIDVNAIPSLGSNPLVNDIIYVASGGGLTSIKPTGTNLIQNVAIVLKASGNGSLQVTAIGRSNDLPNIPQGNIWLGDSNGVPAALTPGANNTVLTSNGTTASWSTALSNYLPLAGGTMTGAITSGSSITALQLIPAAVTLVIAMGASGNQDLVLYDTEFGTFSSFNISASGIPIVEFYINSLTEGATAELFLTTTPTAYVQPSAWQTIPSGGVATPILWPGGTPPNTISGGVYKFTFTMAGGVVYGVADLAFA